MGSVHMNPVNRGACASKPSPREPCGGCLAGNAAAPVPRRILQCLVASLAVLAASALHARPVGCTSSAGQSGLHTSRRQTNSDDTAHDRHRSAQLRACIIEPAEIRSNPEQYLLVDVRSRMDRARLQLPGALNLPLWQVPHSAFIAPDPHRIVLLDKPSKLPRLLRFCARQWRDGDRRYRVLAGGVRGWYRAGGQVTGATSRMATPFELDARALRQLAATPYTWFVVAAAATVPGVLDRRLVHAGGTGPKPVAQALQQVSPNGPLAVVVMSDDRIDRKAWRRVLLAAGLPEPLFYSGGLAAYLEWSRKHRRRVAQHLQPLDSGCRWN